MEEMYATLKSSSQDILENLTEGILMTDAEGRIVFCNPAMAHMLGYSLDKLIGKHWTDIVPADQREIIKAADHRRELGQSDRYEAELLHRDGSRIPTQVSGRPRYQDGAYAGSLAVFTNIQQLKQTEDALRESKETYKTLVNTSPDAVTVTDLHGNRFTGNNHLRISPDARTTWLRSSR
ncbi:MAG: PAS domain S-box protein [Chloroflexota bacterium]